jgi:hypothetical protein
MKMKRTAILAGAALARILGHGAREVSPAEMRRMAEAQQQQREQAGRRRLRGRIAKADHADIVRGSQAELVLGHIHPRWLREEVNRRLDAGEDITEERVEQLRALGPVHVADGIR